MAAAVLCFFALLCLFGACLGLDSEPRCFSRFDYEEKLLEKAVKNDIQIKEVLGKLDHAITAFEGQKTAYEAASAKLENMMTDIADKLNENTTANKRNIVVFFNARKLKNKSPAHSETLTYTIIDQNEGDAFNKVTGIFTAPYAGVYQFFVQICTGQNKWGRVKLVVNDVEIISLCNNNNAQSYTTTSGTTIQRLNAGDRVWVKQDKFNGDVYTDGTTYGWNQFSGVLLYTL